MDYEKKYKEEVVRATQLWECGDITRENLEYIFPELKESEDERNRKGIIKFLIDVNNGAYTKSELESASWIAWLEKQGEQKPKWTEEDSLMIDSIIDTMKWLEGKGATNMKIDWLKSLKKRMGT